MQLIHVAASVLNQTPLAWDANRANILEAIAEARRQQASILCLPELCITGYGCEDAFLSANTRRMAWRVLHEILPATRGMIVSVGLPLLHNNALYNTACLLVDGHIAGFTAKRFLAGDGIHYEPRWFKPWPAERRATIEVDGESFPLGDLFFDCGGVRIGFEICEDAWVANRPGGGLSREGVDIILNPSASHFAFGKDDVRERFVLEGSRAFGVSYVYTNLLGNEAGRAIYDGGAMIASAGRMLAIGPRFSYAEVVTTTAVIDLDTSRLSRAASGSYLPTDDEPHNCVRVPFTFPQRDPVAQHVARAAWERGPSVKEEEFTRALCLALFDYLRKSGSHGFVVSLSGGADSATVACLVGMMVELGVKELGLDWFLQKLGYFTRIQSAREPREIIRSMLMCVYQSTRNSSDTTRSAARGVAEALAAEFLEFDVEPVVQQYTAMVSRAIGRELSWDRDDLALQNIQARARAPSVWLLANLRRALLLSTSNRSEAAVGYATMDGDTAGGLSPIAGIDKAFIRRWLVWLEKQGPEGFGPIPQLAAVNDQAPTAELRPERYSQTDEADLMPYELLDAIERAAIRDKQNPLEVFKLAGAQFPQYNAAELGVWVERFFRLWCRNQWKRERYAPSFHLDDENLDPKTWCRFPILSGGFERELAELREHIAANLSPLAPGTPPERGPRESVSPRPAAGRGAAGELK
jgi:NAD+ synthase (glutamine-hydrolysing)